MASERENDAAGADAYRRALRKIKACGWELGTVLDLSRMGLTSVPPEIGRLTGLTGLNLAGNRLTTVPSELGTLNALTVLRLGNNRITQLPAAIGGLASLRGLDLAGNALTTLPPEIGRLTKLKKLVLFHNQLTHLPAELGRLDELKLLLLFKNRLATLPSALRELASLSELFLHENPALGLPPEVLGPSWRDVINDRSKPKAPREILDFYFTQTAARRRTGTRPLLEAKVLVLGEPKVGKTSLVAAITEREFGRQFEKTRGIARKAWTVPVKEGRAVPASEGEELRLNWWDFGGQEIYLSAHTLFMTARAVYVIVVDERASERQNNLDYWLRMATTFGGEDAPIWVVVNKCDQEGAGPDEKALLRKYTPQLRGFLRTSCRGTGRGIDDARNRIVEEALKLKSVRTPMPKSWYDIKAALESMRADTLSLEEYSRLCVKHGEPDPTAQRSLLGHCNELGTVRFFPTSESDPLELKETAILNPEWVTLGIYALLDDPDPKSRGGLLTESKLASILGRAGYPAGRHRVIEEVMRRFDLIYDTPDYKPEHHLLMPALLPAEEPEHEWPAAETLEFRYRYEVLPPTLMPTFIARTHKWLARDQSPWRKGCILELDGCRARMIADADAREVSISVTGAVGNRRDVLDRIRFIFEELQTAIKRDVLQLIPVPGHPDAPLMDYDHLRALEWKEIPTYEAKGSHHRETITVNVREVLDGIRGERMRQSEERTFIVHGDYVEGDKTSKSNVNTGSMNGSVMGDNNVSSTAGSFNGVAAPDDLAKLVQALERHIASVCEELRIKDARLVREQLEIFIDQASSPGPDLGQMSVSGNNLIAAAMTVAKLAQPVAETIRCVIGYHRVTPPEPTRPTA